MKRIRPVLFGVLLMAWATPVKADWTTLFSGSYTGGDKFATTASITLKYEFSGTTGIYLYWLSVTNEGIYGEVYKAIGLINIPFTVDPKTMDFGVSAPPGWTKPPPADLGGIDPDEYAYNAAKPPTTEGLMPGQTGVFQFRVSGLTATEALHIGAGVHGISGPSSCSTKMGVVDGVVVRAGPYDESCVPTTAPEPSSMILLGTGMLGLIGMAYRRRREG